MSLRNSAHPQGGFVDGQQFRQQGATYRYGMAAFTLAGGDGYQCVAVVVVGAQHLADDGGATGLVDVEHKDGTLGVVSSIEGLQSDLDGGGFAQAVIGVFGAPDVADGVDIAVGSDAGTQFVGTMAQDNHDLVSAGGAQGHDLMDDQGPAIPVQQGF